MTTSTISTSTRPKGFRWLYIILGIVLFVFGIGILRHPVISYLGLALYFSIIIMIIGIGEILNAFSGKHARHWGWGFTLGIIDLIIGFVLLTNPGITEDILPYIVGFILLFKSIDFISDSLQMSSLKIGGWGWILTGGILTLIFSFMIIFYPVWGALNIIIWTGLCFIFAGISSFIYAFIDKR
ncbi:HdeD family acid-resistance protein [Gabonibacter chumensis]|uniref:HdeD family acid-resistance protein n=1 Tax=Gabonibacter chumensis TaxID=2972474 RepID=UPI00257313A2|nr:DUF308 domain-containing protein [Gabonibacter chumensis]MCR9012253.1 DUF308 domain-containing protein [Gabonibacter chumensis]